jgi:hypothetical protein
MTLMTKEEARRQVLRVWDNWAKENIAKGAAATGTDALLFHAFLSSERDDLLRFRDKGPDKYQTIHGWLLHAGKVKD